VHGKTTETIEKHPFNGTSQLRMLESN